MNILDNFLPYKTARKIKPLNGYKYAVQKLENEKFGIISIFFGGDDGDMSRQWITIPKFYNDGKFMGYERLEFNNRLDAQKEVEYLMVEAKHSHDAFEKFKVMCEEKFKKEQLNEEILRNFKI